jgi:HPt (histidine-containing phosphotransfer) domain-containing protein
MVELFRAESPELLSALRASIASNDAAALARTAHALNGSMRNFGPTEGVDPGRELEQMGRDGVLVGADERFRMLEEQLVRLERDLAAFVATPDTSI